MLTCPVTNRQWGTTINLEEQFAIINVKIKSATVFAAKKAGSRSQYHASQVTRISYIISYIYIYILL